jgi:hypothetical protein
MSTPTNLIFAVLLAVMQTTPPVPRQTPDSTTSTSGKVQKQSKSNKTAAAQTPPIVKTDATPTTTGNDGKQGQDNKEHSISIGKLPTVTVDPPKRDWVDWGIWLFNGLLVVVGFLQYRILRRQAVLMGNHATELKSLATAAEKNLRAYVFPSSVTRFRNNGVLKLKVVFTNSGRTPAYACTSWVFEGIHSGPNKPIFPKDPPQNMHSTYFIASDGETEVFDEALPIGAEDYKFISNGIRALYLVGEVKYQDVFNEHRTTRFRLISSKSDFVADRFTFCEEGNDAD